MTHDYPGRDKALDDPGNALDKTDKLMVIALLAVGLLLCGAGWAFSGEVAIGDSIAKGTGEALGVETHAVVGASSCAIVGYVPAGHFDHVLISAGINDGGACVGKVRAKVDGDVVVWVLPARINAGYRAVRLMARKYGDRLVRYDCTGGCTKKNFHPASYAKVAKWVRVKWANGSLPPVVSASVPVRSGR